MKKLMLITAPITSRSGYGAHARDLVESILDNDNFDVLIEDVPWGNCPRNALNLNDNKVHQIMEERIINKPNPTHSLNKQPDVYVDIRIPNEFRQIGKKNVGITAGVETTAVSSKWLEDCNKMDLVIVPSEHSKGGFINTTYDKVQNLPNGQQQVVGQLKLEKPMEVVFEGADEDIYKPLTIDEIDSDFFDMLNEKVPEKFAFLMVGQWTKGGYGEDRKDIGTLVKVFYESFANKKKQPALILKTNGAGHSIMDREECLQKLTGVKAMFPTDWKLPNVYLLHGEFSDMEMNYLYNHPKVKAMVSFTHGEGFGRPLLEATMTGLPVIAPNWSGQTDFLNTEKCLLLGGDLIEIPESMVWENILVEKSKWFKVNESESYKVLNYAFENPIEIKNKAKSLMNDNRNKFKLSDMSEILNNSLNNLIKDLPNEVKLTLPKLKKTSNKNVLPKLKIPKLKSVGEGTV